MTDTSIAALLAADAPAATVGEDPLRGVPAIAEFLRQTERRVYYLLEQHRIPCGNEGSSWIASRRALRAHYERLTAGDAA